MKYVITIIALLLMANQIHAAWSRFAHVTPETENKFNITVSLLPLDETNNEFLVLVRLNAIEVDKQAWLIITYDGLSENEQQFRDVIWNSEKPEKKILLRTKLMPKGVSSFLSEDNDLKFYEVVLDAKHLKHSYIYIDFPWRVLDGGYFYSIDLPAYLKKYQKNDDK